MSTSYEIAKSGAVEFVVGEGSNKFDLTIEDFTQDQPTAALEGLSTAQLIEVATRMLRVASYWGADEDDIRNAGDRALSSEQLPPVKVQ